MAKCRVRTRGPGGCADFLSLERRVLFSAAAGPAVQAIDYVEAEPNNTVASATPIVVSAKLATASCAVSSSADVDFYAVALAQRSGVFFDVDARAAGGGSALDSALAVFRAADGALLGSNDDAYDFDAITLTDDTHTP